MKTDFLNELRVVPVVVIKELADTVPTLSALCEGGLPVAEITFRTACAAEAIALGVKEFPEMHIGAGTVINAEQARRAIEAGAQFMRFSCLIFAVHMGFVHGYGLILIAMVEWRSFPMLYQRMWLFHRGTMAL